MNTWKTDESKIILIVKDLYHNCSIFFDTLLSRSEQDSLWSSLINLDEENNDEMILQFNYTLHKIIATDQLMKKYCKEILKVSTRSSDVLITSFFKSQLRTAFTQNYQMTNVMYFEIQNFQWCCRIEFISKYNYNKCFWTFIINIFTELQSNNSSLLLMISFTFILILLSALMICLLYNFWSM